MKTRSQIRIAVIANKTWECEPLVGVLLSRDARPPRLDGFLRGYDPAERQLETDPQTGKPPRLPPEAEGLDVRGKLPIRPRLTLEISKGAGLAEVWCLEDWMRRERRKAEGDQTRLVPLSTASSHEKFHFALPMIRQRTFEGHEPDLVIAFGTAGNPSEVSLNGSVAVGTRVFVHDPWHGASQETIQDQMDRYGPMLRGRLSGFLDNLIESPRLRDDLFLTGLSPEAWYSAEARFLCPPVNPAPPLRVLAGHGYASLGTINICDYGDYVWADEETLRNFFSQVRQREVGSMETTHGLIRLTWPDTPFLYTSGITDRVPMFNAEVTPRKYAQNFAAAHNAGAALAFLLPELTRLFSEGRLFVA